MSIQEQGDSPKKRYGMVIDVNRCVGCHTCTISCKHANDTMPGVQWRSVLDVEKGEFPDVERFFLVVGCQHCAEPPCVPVCPSGATYQRDDGLIAMDYDLCIGCGYCAVACPYQARTLAHEMKFAFGKATVQEQHSAHPERIGVAQKCTFCIDRVDEANERGLTPGVDLEVTPVCSASCIAKAIRFGDFADPASEVSQLVAEHASFQLNDFLGTDPQIKYLYEVPNAIPGRTETAPTDDELRDLNNPLAGPLQEFWDYRAAMNFIMGGMGSGFIMLASLLALAGFVPLVTLGQAAPIGGVAIMIGLFFVLLEIGRKLRAFKVMRRPSTSWMTREVYVVIVLYPLLALIWWQPSRPAAAALALTAAVFLVCQARILYAGKGIPAWRAPLMPWMICVSGLSEGGGLALLASAVTGATINSGAIEVFAASAVIAMIVLWFAYIGTAKNNWIPSLARDVLKTLTPIYVGALGAALIALWLGGAQAGATLTAIAGVLLIAAGALWKLVVITRASYQQGFILPKVPQRGSGSYAAPHRPAGLSVRAPV
jgi:phenylacetyl-CoA:acceptor oxidoreductase subunit 1